MCWALISHWAFICAVDDIVDANIDPSTPSDTWDLDSLANKMKQYCVMMDDLTVCLSALEFLTFWEYLSTSTLTVNMHVQQFLFLTAS